MGSPGEDPGMEPPEDELPLSAWREGWASLLGFF